MGKEKGEKIDLFSADRETINSDVRASFETFEHSYVAKWVDKMVMKKPSVSLNMIKLAVVFLCAWILAFAYAVGVSTSVIPKPAQRSVQSVATSPPSQLMR